MSAWPTSEQQLTELQFELGDSEPPLWSPRAEARIGACFLCFERGSSGPGHKGERAWAAAALGEESVIAIGAAGAPYLAGLLALREGALLEEAVRRLTESPDALLVNATGRDHPRRAGLALHLGAVLGLPTVGVTHRTLVAGGDWPADEQGARSPLVLPSGELVGYWLRTRRGHRPLAVHAAWRTSSEIAVEIVYGCVGTTRTPQPLRLARRAARTARAET